MDPKSEADHQRPPVPYPIEDATCGPTVPGTVFFGDKPLKDYNPCPLNV